MELPEDIDGVESLLRRMRCPKELFGTDPNKVFRHLAKLLHPDRNPGDKNAEDLYKRVQGMYAKLEEPLVVIKSKKRPYTLLKILAVGDVADVHLAEGNRDGTTQEYLLKISRVAGGEKLLDNERKVLSELLTKAGDSTYRKYFPTLVESFPASDKITKRVNVFIHEPENFYTGEVLHDKIPSLSGRHLAWMFKRLLTAIGFAHRSGYVHAAVLPSHLRFQTTSHGMQLTSWGHSVEKGGIVKTVSSKYRDWYPPEILNKQKATAQSDVYMAAKCMFYLAGADPNNPASVPAELIPIPMQRFFQSCLLPGAKMRPDDAWSLHEEFDELLKVLYGKPRFHVLNFP